VAHDPNHERGALIQARETRGRIDAHPAHSAQIDHESAVPGTQTRNIVATAANGEWQAGVARHVDAGDDVGRVYAPDDERGTTVDHCVVHTAGCLVGASRGAITSPRI